MARGYCFSSEAIVSFAPTGAPAFALKRKAILPGEYPSAG